MNMSYCRFHNTNLAVEDCLETLRNMEGGYSDEEEAPLSQSEYESCRDLFTSFLNFCIEEGIVEESENEISEKLEEFFDKILVE